MLHLPAIMVQTKNGQLPERSFFSRISLKKQVKEIIKILAD